MILKIKILPRSGYEEFLTLLSNSCKKYFTLVVNIIFNLRLRNKIDYIWLDSYIYSINVYLVVMKGELSKKTKLSIFKTVFVLILTYGHVSWVMIERVRSQVQTSEMRFLKRIEGIALFNKMRSTEIQKFLNIESLLLRIERSQLRWFGHVTECLRKDSPNKLYMPKQMVEDQLDDLKLDGPTTQRILNEIAWDFAQTK